MQAGCRVWCGVRYGDGSDGFSHSSVLAHQRQSVSSGKLQGVLQGLLQRQSGERLVVVMDSAYVYKGVVGWSAKWQRHRWRCSMGEVGHRDLWERILWLREAVGGGLCATALGAIAVRCSWK